MFHLVARSTPRTLLFRNHTEASTLWHAFARAFGEVLALCLMPDHVHLALAHRDEAGRFCRAIQAYAQWRNAARGESGHVWAPHPPPEPLADEQKARTVVRYIHLNPCRARLVSDPLAWPWSTHRDTVGLSAFPLARRERDPVRYHAYVSGDPSVSVQGSELPAYQVGTSSWFDVRDAVSATCRVTFDALCMRGPARTLALRTAWACGVQDADVLAAGVRVAPSSVWRTVQGVRPRGAVQPDPALAACIRAVGDPRFAGLGSDDLTRGPTWRAYAGRRRG